MDTTKKSTSTLIPVSTSTVSPFMSPSSISSQFSFYTQISQTWPTTTHFVSSQTSVDLKSTLTAAAKTTTFTANQIQSSTSVATYSTTNTSNFVKSSVTRTSTTSTYFNVNTTVNRFSSPTTSISSGVTLATNLFFTSISNSKSTSVNDQQSMTNSTNTPITFNSGLTQVISYSLAQNVSLSALLNQGYKTVYNQTYSHASTTNELMLINESCTQNTVLCAGGALGDSDILTLLSCGNCWTILSATLRNRPVLNNGAYWYLTPSFSFGFAPNSSIQQNTCDRFDTSNVFRLCWHLDQSVGGWRLGTLQWFLNTDFNYNKYLFFNSILISYAINSSTNAYTVNSSLTIN